jgi:hypothetical protein
MLIWDFNVIIALGMTIGLGVVIGLWVFYTLSEGYQSSRSSQQYFCQCSFCGYLYFDYFNGSTGSPNGKKPGVCPRCGSYQD